MNHSISSHSVGFLFFLSLLCSIANTTAFLPGRTVGRTGAPSGAPRARARAAWRRAKANVPAADETNWQEEVMGSSVPVLALFSAPWCGPCRMTIPVVEGVAEEVDPDTLKVVAVCTDESPELAFEMKITSIPTMLVIRNGKVVDSFVGAVPKSSLLTMIRANLGIAI